jgi:hypothetical protein
MSFIEFVKKAGIERVGNTWICNTSNLETLSEMIRQDERIQERQRIANWYNESDAGDSWPWFVEKQIRTGGYLND